MRNMRGEVWRAARYQKCTVPNKEGALLFCSALHGVPYAGPALARLGAGGTMPGLA
jgi:hypothetical protein